MFRSVIVSLVIVVWAASPLPAQVTADSALADLPYELPPIVVVGTPATRAVIPGSAEIIDAAMLRGSRVSTIGEALRKAAGVHARDEEGFGLRPNIGIRGLDPTRSSKVLLLEDGIPLVIAPYGDNASYYHPPVDRFERIEVLKGSGQILFGPQTIGGVINYITPPIPSAPEALVVVAPGNRHYLNGRVRAGGPVAGGGVMVDLMRKQGDGARENVGSRLYDASMKAVLPFGADQALTLRGNYYSETSQVTYSGLTESEFTAAPFANAFRNDSMFLRRLGASATHRITPGGPATLTTTAYAYRVSRDWYRQSSNSTQRPNDAADPACGSIANLSTTCGNEGRLREYTVGGLEPRLRLALAPRGVSIVIDAGVRAHYEIQRRRQVNGDTPNARAAVGDSADHNSGLKEHNERRTQAYSGFVQARALVGRFAVVPGLRVEHVRYERANLLPLRDNLAVVSGRTGLTAFIPGVGFTYQAGGSATLFAGAHRGFAPPRTEDVIDNATGGVVELDAETSWNYEVGMRTALGGARIEATLFRMDFDHQIIPASLAGGTGAALTSAGRTLHQGLEVSTRLDAGSLLGTMRNVFVQAAWTYLHGARFEGDRFAYIGTGGSDVAGKVYAGQNGSGTREQVRVTGNRLPYAPKHLLTATASYEHPTGFDVRMEAVYVGRQFGDALNTEALSPDGQQGPISAATVWNAAVSYHFRALRNTVFLTAKNLFDNRYIVDRTRGILPGGPRLVMGGFSQVF